jgi:hypothetical protein
MDYNIYQNQYSNTYKDFFTQYKKEIKIGGKIIGAIIGLSLLSLIGYGIYIYVTNMQASGQTSGQASGQTSGQISRQTSGQASGQTSGQTSGQISRQTSGQTSGKTSGQTSGQSNGPLNEDRNRDINIKNVMDNNKKEVSVTSFGLGSWYNNPNNSYKAYSDNNLKKTWDGCQNSCLLDSNCNSFTRFHTSASYYPEGRECALFNTQFNSNDIIKPTSQGGPPHMASWEGNVVNVNR